MASERERDALYYTLLRAREEHADLLAYREFLAEESRRLEAFATETRTRAETVPRRLQRPTQATVKPLVEALGRRRSVIEEERRRIDDRVAQAQAFVEECEADLEASRGR